jgi:hypothetical protein
MHSENTERPWCNPPEQDGDGVPGSGGTTPGTRKFLRGPSWTIGIQQPTQHNTYRTGNGKATNLKGFGHQTNIFLEGLSVLSVHAHMV